MVWAFKTKDYDIASYFFKGAWDLETFIHIQSNSFACDSVIQH